jgi:hypothetical protein
LIGRAGVWIFNRGRRRILLAQLASLGRDEMGNLWHAFYLELMNRVLQDAVSIGHALVLAQMLKP